MPRTPAHVTQADITRALRAVRAVGGGVVEVRPDGTILIRPGGELAAPPPTPDGPARDIVL